MTQDAGAQRLNATTTLPSSLAKSVAGGPIDVVRFFVDEGPSNATGSSADTHPSLAEATLDPIDRSYFDIQPLIEEVEDFQIAYGVDGIDGTPADSGVSPVAVDLSGVNKDEWVGNVATEVETTLPVVRARRLPRRRCERLYRPVGPVPPAAGKHLPAAAFDLYAAGDLHGSPRAPVGLALPRRQIHGPRLRFHGGPGARGFQVLDSNIKNFFDGNRPPLSAPDPVSFAVSLRNYL